MDYSNQPTKMTDKKLYRLVSSMNCCLFNITSASFAGNSLWEAPFYTLNLIGEKLMFLSLKNNNFSPTTYIIFNKKYGKCVLMSAIEYFRIGNIISIKIASLYRFR